MESPTVVRGNFYHFLIHLLPFCHHHPFLVLAQLPVCNTALCSACPPGHSCGWRQAPALPFGPGADLAADATPQMQAGLYASLQPAAPHPSLFSSHLPH